METEITPRTNDSNWALYFGTCDTKYLDAIIDTLKWMEERVDLNKFLTAHSAAWSLCSNAEQHTPVRKYLKKVADENVKVAKLLSCESWMFEEEIIKVMNDQISKGIWKRGEDHRL